MTDTDSAVTTVVTHNRDSPDQKDLDGLAASLDYLRVCWGEPDTVADSPSRDAHLSSEQRVAVSIPVATRAPTLLVRPSPP